MRCGSDSRERPGGHANGRLTHRGRPAGVSGAAPVARGLRRTLRYTRQVIDEALRLYPPTWVTARTPIEADAIGHCRIPSGSLVLLSPYVTHRHPEFWEAPETFDPDRFAPSRSVGRPSYAYFPFGGGPRLCAGAARRPGQP
ncbi:MAG: cytochrome P450 [Candidatus Rokubacteria bacterium]|nr:cytochrome P450 [Candidatus Rokubacteria bacterium]